MIIVHFIMADRNEYDIYVDEKECDACCGANNVGALRIAREKLIGEIVKRYSVPDCDFTVPDTAYTEIAFQLLTSTGGPAINKKDGVETVRSPLQKVRLDLVPAVPLALVAKVFTFGAAQYGDQNWRGGFSYSRCYGAAMRHMMKWWLGQETDEESNTHHLAHAIVNLMFLIEYQRTGAGRDDREIVTPEQVEALFAKFNTEITPKK